MGCLYGSYGFSDAKKMIRSALDGKYALPSLNYIAIEQINAIGDAIIEKNSPTLIMVAPKHCVQFDVRMLVQIAYAMVERVRDSGCGAPIALHLDHGNTFEECKLAIDNGFSSVMIDGSGMCLEDNIRLTKSVVEYAAPFGVMVEGEVGALSGAEDADEQEKSALYTSACDAAKFIKETGVDCLAVSIGTIHGLNKAGGKRQFEGLKMDLLQEIEAATDHFPLVLHGCSSLPKKYIDMINAYGGNLEHTVGIPDDCLEAVSSTSVCKINIASDGWIPSTAVTRKVLAIHPETIDSRLYRKEIREELFGIYCHKMDIFHSTGKG